MRPGHLQEVAYSPTRSMTTPEVGEAGDACAWYSRVQFLQGVALRRRRGRRRGLLFAQT